MGIYLLAYLIGVFSCIEDKSRGYDLPREREHIERPIDQMIPLTGHIQTTDLVVAPCLVLN